MEEGAVSTTAIERANDIVRRYRDISGPYYSEPPQTVMEDILADLRTLAHHTGVDWVKAVDMAELHFEEENEL